MRTPRETCGRGDEPYDIRAETMGARHLTSETARSSVAIGICPIGSALSPFLVGSSGSPFNVTVGQDLFGTGVFNARPALVSASATGPNSPQGCSICVTPLGTFNTMPAAGQALIPSNYYEGPGQFTLNLRFEQDV